MLRSSVSGTAGLLALDGRVESGRMGEMIDGGRCTLPALYCVTLWLVCFLQSLPLQ